MVCKDLTPIVPISPISQKPSVGMMLMRGAA
jgi:hypothetical protein